MHFLYSKYDMGPPPPLQGPSDYRRMPWVIQSRDDQIGS